MNNPSYVKYHDEEWGVPVHDDRRLFEMLILEGAQAGLSWATVLKKRESYRRAFDGFDPDAIARYGQSRITSLMENPGIIRNRLKLMSAIRNAQVCIGIIKEYGSLDRFLWSFVGRPTQNSYRSFREIPVKTDLSDTISKDLKARGMNFVGSTIIYAFMQAVGMVNDHETSCFRYEEIRKLGL